MAGVLMRVGIFIQVRLGSMRLPAKALLALPGGNIIQHVMRAMARVPADVRALVTEEGSARALAPLAREEGFQLFLGPRDDVLARYCLACREFRADHVVRATGDNPLTSPALATSILERHVREGPDLSHYLGIPLGSGVEVIRAQSLFAAEGEATDPADREHVTPLFYRHRGRFRVEEPQGPPAFLLPEARVTVDTAEDYAQVKRIFEDLYAGNPIETDRVVSWFRSGARVGQDRA